MTNNEVAICIIAAGVVVFALIFAGGHLENRRIYNNCLDNAQQMPYAYARTLCLELTK